jgi:pimeloyl-ACP methyl ester carboxylesterase
MKAFKKFISFLIVIAVFSSCKKEKFEYSGNAKPSITISGTGNITLVLEAGMGNWSLFYKKVIPELSARYKVVTVNRAGYNNEVVPNQCRDAATIAEELHEALEGSSLGDSIVLVGHSFGGLVVRMYQNLYPQKVVGLVLLDAAHPNQFDILPSPFNQLKEDQKKGMKKLVKTAQRGWLKSNSGKKRIPTFNLPEDMLNDYYSITTEPQYYATYAKEVSDFDASLNQVRVLSSLGSLPLLVLASEHSMDESTMQGVKKYPYVEHNQAWLTLQRELAELSTNSSFASTTLSNHYLSVFQPEWTSQEIVKFITAKVRNK